MTHETLRNDLAVLEWARSCRYVGIDNEKCFGKKKIFDVDSFSPISSREHQTSFYSNYKYFPTKANANSNYQLDITLSCNMLQSTHSTHTECNLIKSFHHLQYAYYQSQVLSYLHNLFIHSTRHTVNLGAFLRNVPSHTQAMYTSSHITDTPVVSWQPHTHSKCAC